MRKLIQILSLLLFALPTFGQVGNPVPGWSVYESNLFGGRRTLTHLVRSDGDIVALTREVNSGIRSLTLEQYDDFGTKLWSQGNLAFGDQFGEWGLDALGPSHYFLSFRPQGVVKPLRIFGFDINGNQVWSDSLPTTSTKWQRAFVDEADRIICTGVDSIAFTTQLRILDSNRVVLLDTAYPASEVGFSEVIGLENGKLGFYNIVSSDTVVLGLVEPTGAIAWKRKYFEPSANIAKLIGTSDGGLAYANRTFTVFGNECEVFKVDALGDSLWRSEPDTSDLVYLDLIATENGGAVLLRNQANPFHGISLTKYDSLGGISWKRYPSEGRYYHRGQTLTNRVNGGWVISGESDGSSQDTSLLIATNTFGLVGGSTAEGYVYFDANADCNQNANDMGLPNVLLRANPGNHYAITNAVGHYEFNLDSGTYWISIVPQNQPFQVGCPVTDSIQFTFPGISSTVDSLDFAMEATGSCPYLTVDLSTPVIRWCDSIWVYTVEYCNLGAVSADTPYVVVELDPGLSYLSSTAPAPAIALGGNAYLFELDTLDVGECGSFQIRYFVSCSLSLGESVCSSAHIYPDTLCTPPDSNWSGASLEVTGECLPGDTIQFKVDNVGSGNMLSPSGILIAEDDLLKTNFSVLLNSGEDTLIGIAGNGSTWAMFAEQVPFHPGISLPRAMVEGCGVDSAGNFSTGFVTSYGQDDQNPFLDIDCQEVVASYDPNDKRGFPLGLGEEGEITFEDDLEYMIRFQNTGTAPAYKVVIYDELPEELDMTTFVPGSSSHPHTLEIIGRTLRWTFDPIVLPDSGADEAGSHGYVKFTIDQANSLQYGDQIRNAARIVFDQNEAILTDTSLHTLVPDLTFALEVAVEPRAPEAPGLTVWPNPARESAQFLLEDGPYRELNLEVYTIEGRLIRREARRNTSTLKLERNGLAPGLYLFRLTTENGQTAGGKLLIQ